MWFRERDEVDNRYGRAEGSSSRDEYKLSFAPEYL